MTVTQPATNDEPSGVIEPVPVPVDAPSVAQRTIILHESGDVTLLIGSGEELQPVLVSSPVLRLASPVWNAMFAHHWAESEAHEIPFPEDNVEAMLIVLRIAHLHFKDIPQRDGLTFDMLFHLAVVCDKYDLVKLIRPFLNLHCWAEQFVYPTSSGDYWPDWLFVAWAFGYTDSFDALARLLAYTTSVDANGCIQTAGRRIFTEQAPLDIFDNMKKVREDALSSMLKSCYDILDNIVRGSICTAKDKDGKSIDGDKCRCTILGSYVAQLIGLGLYPERKSGADIHMSVRDLQQKLVSIKVLTHDSVDYGKMALLVERNHARSCWTSESGSARLRAEVLISHTECGKVVNLKACAKQIVSEMPSPMLDSHRRHMEEQAKK